MRIKELDNEVKETVKYELEELDKDKLEQLVKEYESGYYNTVQELMSELAEMMMPIYTSDIVELALDNLSWATAPCDLIDSNEKSAADIIGGWVYDYLEEYTFNELLNKLQELSEQRNS